MQTKRYTLTSDKFSGEIIFEFTDMVLTKYDTSNAELSDEQIVYFAKNLPRELAEVEAFLNKSQSAKFEEIKEEITFDMFWNRYDDKQTSSKKKTETKWNKMTKSQQAKAYNHVLKYFATLPFNTRKKFAETYLNAELWNN